MRAAAFALALCAAGCSSSPAPVRQIVPSPTPTVPAATVAPTPVTVAAASSPSATARGPQAVPVATVRTPDACDASWYAKGLPNPDGLTAASRDVPRGGLVEVTRGDGAASVVVRINDYGPEAYTGRCIDLSRGAMRMLGGLSAGVIPVRLRRIA